MYKKKLTNFWQVFLLNFYLFKIPISSKSSKSLRKLWTSLKINDHFEYFLDIFRICDLKRYAAYHFATPNCHIKIVLKR